MKENEDLFVVLEILRGKTDSYEKILQKYNNKLYGHIFKLVHDKHTAEELTHSVFIKAYKSLDKFDKGKSFSVWLFAIAKNTVIDHFKYMKRHSTIVLVEELDSYNDEDMGQSPEHIIERKETIQMVDQVIEYLPPKYKDLILLRYFEELSYESIAARLNLSPNEVKWRLHQARKKMVQCIEDRQNQESRCRAYGV